MSKQLSLRLARRMRLGTYDDLVETDSDGALLRMFREMDV